MQKKNSQKTSLQQSLIQFLHKPTRRHCPCPVERPRVATLGGRGNDLAAVGIPYPKKKQSECSAFIRVPQASEVGLSFSSSDAIPPSSVGNKALSMPALCHAFYLSTLPSASLSLPSAVGHSSVAASTSSKEHRKQAVNTFL